MTVVEGSTRGLSQPNEKSSPLKNVNEMYYAVSVKSLAPGFGLRTFIFGLKMSFIINF